jgi:hypothetical protein
MDMDCLNSLPKSFGQSVIAIFGCPSAGFDPGTTMVMVDQDETSYVQFPTEAVLHTASIPDDGGKIFWLPSSTKLTFGGYE